MIVVADAGPLQYLFLIGQLEVLQLMYATVTVPRSVAATELNDPATPAKLREYFQSPPPWIEIHDDPPSIPPLLATLGLGEQSAISLSLELRADLLLCDDASARKKAAALGLNVIGTLGILEEAAFRGHLDFNKAIDNLTRNTNFHHSPNLIDQVRKRHAARLNPPKP